eukprot:TRINITY_DN4413_c0_g1_i2.p1 TRINITY_DN4413_c0_g1~~TRINITY_DN4413_c0_g1_i2.p1  ORF type:complete len:249 (+),score=28.77 TRINITY_DN4413_c0_g1_i2:78-824(+)
MLKLIYANRSKSNAPPQEKEPNGQLAKPKVNGNQVKNGAPPRKLEDYVAANTIRKESAGQPQRTPIRAKEPSKLFQPEERKDKSNGISHPLSGSNEKDKMMNILQSVTAPRQPHQQPPSLLVKRKRTDNPNWAEFMNNNSNGEHSNHSKGERTFEVAAFDPFKILNPLPTAYKGETPIVALDCEMVMVQGNQHVLARCSIVNYNGHVLLDMFFRPRQRVSNYLTWVSGITASDLSNAPHYDEANQHKV